MPSEILKKEAEENKYLMKIKALEDLQAYIKKMPFDKYEIEHLMKHVQFEINMLEYQLERELGQREFSKLKQSL